MEFLRRGAIIAALLAAGGSVAQAQTANATAPNAQSGGPNQAQQFPSGGTKAPNGTATPGGGTPQIGAPTAVEVEEQQKGDKTVNICKGC